MLRRRLLSGTSCLLPALGLTAVLGLHATEARAQATPSAQDLVTAANDNANWILPAMSYTANHYTGADKISPANVKDLQLAWKFTMDDAGPLEVSPIVYNGTMFVTSAHDHVYALDAATGKLKWEFKDSPHVISFAANRGIGLIDGNVYIATLDVHRDARRPPDRAERRNRQEGVGQGNGG
ncbi:outer membrane protein assembly factor BamB family protein [Rhodopila globiformis]|nr:PQQ-binding-like beta-propeller repeat protein [Rhodopila globiformis]